MKNIFVTGSKGFIGSNLVLALTRIPNIKVFQYDVGFSESSWEEGINNADVIFHLAGVNRPEKEEEYEKGNVAFTRYLLKHIDHADKKPVIVFSSSVQAELDNPYGISKRRAEQLLAEWSESKNAAVLIYRLPNVFGKWCRPNYNSAVATFCYNIARRLDINIADPEKILRLVYIDDVVDEFIRKLEVEHKPGCYYHEVKPTFEIKITDVVRLIEGFKESRKTLILPDFSDPFIKRLYATYISYLPESDFAYQVPVKSDNRGELAEIVKLLPFGQIFISRTRPGETRGNHYHDTKVEKIVVIEGEALLRFRHVLKNDVIEYRISGSEFKVIDIPPGYTHSIENAEDSDLIVLFWANEIFESDRPDTYHLEVNK